MVSLRSIREDEYRAFWRAEALAFGHPDSAEEAERERGLFELDRSLAAFDGATIVGTSCLLSLSLRVPGGELRCPVVTCVSVARTHRRRGLLVALMRGLLDDARGRGEPLVALFASEAGIYGRFGFGPATHEGTVRIERRASAFRRDAPPPGPLRSVDAEEARELFARVYDDARARTTAMPSRSAVWWDAEVLADPPDDRDGYGPKDLVVAVGDQGPDGYAVSRVQASWRDGIADGTVEVLELVANTPAALSGLWRYCLDADLCERLVAWRRPRVEPLEHLLADPRRLRRTDGDGLWLRFVDLPAALGARAWTGTGRLTLDVADPFLPEQGGTWTLTVEDGAGACTRGSGPADLALDTEGLAACYLGDTRPAALLAAGRLRERTPGAARRLDALLGVTDAPWAPQSF